jgi:hypothetical protein
MKTTYEGWSIQIRGKLNRWSGGQKTWYPQYPIQPPTFFKTRSRARLSAPRPDADFSFRPVKIKVTVEEVKE